MSPTTAIAVAKGDITMAAASVNSSSNDRARAIPTSAEKHGDDRRSDQADLPFASQPPAANASRAKIELDARKATELVEQARRKFEADEAAAKLAAATELPLDVTDAQIDELALARVRASIRADVSKRALAAAEEAAKPIVEQAARLAREAERREAFEDQAEIVERFRSEYPEAASKLLRLFAEAHAIEMAGAKLGNKDLSEGEESFVSAFHFARPDPPSRILVQVLDRSGVVMWQGDQNSDVASQQF
jgi:hypothetical protein